MPNAAKIWQTREASLEAVRRVALEQGLSEPLARILVSRGFDHPQAAERYLNPRLRDLGDPLALPGMEQAVVRIGQAVERKEAILVFGDYDVDGITSTALLVRVLARLGVKATPFLPHRVEDGYGLSLEALRKCLDAHKPDLIITVDCGTGSVEAVREAAQSGVDVVVTDHHEPPPEIAAACAVVNPKLSPATRDEPLAGVGVVFKLCHALIKMARAQGLKAGPAIDLRDLLDYVAVGTIADIVPLTGENRILARRGLERLNETTSVGFRALREVAGIGEHVEAYHVGFLLGPRLNAAGRLGDAQKALELLMTDEATRAREIALHLDAVNRERQNVESVTLDEATAVVDGYFMPGQVFGLVVAGDSWHPGVVGIVASRLVARYYRPAVVIARQENGTGRGSCRSIESFNMLDALDACSEFLIQHGGHAMAAGLEIDLTRLDAFREAFNEVARKRLAGDDLRPVQRVDAWVELPDADRGLLEGAEALRPFGHGNPTPVWAAHGVRVAGAPRVVGKGHLKLRVAQKGVQRDCIGFGLAERELPPGPLDIAFHLKLNRYMGRETLQLSLQDFRPTDGEGHDALCGIK